MTFAPSLQLHPLMAFVPFGLDTIWPGVVAKGFDARALAHLMGPDVKWVPACVFSGIFLVGVEVFAWPSPMSAAIAGAGSVIDRLGFHALGLQHRTEVERGRVERVIGGPGPPSA